jgi:carbon storage regulator
MLVLSRKNQEEIVIGDSITVTILKVKGSTVKLGIEAPKELRVRRSELVAKEMAAENAANRSLKESVSAKETAAANEPAATNETVSERETTSSLTLCDYIAHKDATVADESDAEEAELPSSSEANSAATEYVPYYAI